MRKYKQKNHLLRHAYPATKVLVAGGVAFSIALFLSIIARTNAMSIFSIELFIDKCILMFSTIAIGLILTSGVLLLLTNDEKRIEHSIKKGFFDSSFGNPLHFHEDEKLPLVKCQRISGKKYDLVIETTPRIADNLENCASAISSCLTGRYKTYAVTSCKMDISFNNMTYRIEDVMIDNSLIATSAEDLLSQDVTKIPIDRETFLDLTSSGSMLIAGKTRSGKTTGIISILISVLQHGRDEYFSNIMIVDPKQAELSRLPYVVTLDKDGEARTILDQMKNYAEVIKSRQEVLNKRSERKGDAVKWWERGECKKTVKCAECGERNCCTESSMHPSFLFIDEYVALRSIFPSRASKEDGGYNLTNFDSVLKRIVTMGASAGCFVIISIAEASVGEAGLPSMLKSAMSTKVLFRPTVEEARLLWNSDQIQVINTGRNYVAGDCWLSSTDGIHDMPGYVHFPRMDFAVYAELSRLLIDYYAPRD